jgi:ABC-2 type transport system ATP-binding protein
MTTIAGRLAEVKSYFDNGDIHVGYRRLLDLAIETQDSSVYESTLGFCNWYDAHGSSNTNEPGSLNEQVNTLLEKISNAPFKESTTNSSPKLKTNQVGKTYHSGSFSLSSVDLSLYPSQIVGLVGENGNGKTTLLRLLYGELSPDTGSIEYHLSNIPKRHGFYDIKTRLSFIPQRPQKWYGLLMDNLQFTATHYGFKGKENYLWTEMICARMGLRAFRGYTWNRISSGYKMRFELAKALLKKPEVLLLDEPLANLDVLAQQVILEDLRFLAKSQQMPLGIILSSQQLYEVEKVSEQVIFLKQGKPKYQQTQFKPEEQVAIPLVIELETTASRKTLQNLFKDQSLENISFNGGVYILYFRDTAQISDIMRTIGDARLPVKYFRDISASSRRFFDA